MQCHWAVNLKTFKINKMDYKEAVEKLKEHYPETKDLKGRFYIENGELWYEGFDVPDMNKMQNYINEILEQKVFRAEYVGYIDVYAVSEEEAKEFLNHNKPKTVSRIKVYEVSERSF